MSEAINEKAKTGSDYEVEGMDVGYLRCTHEGCGAGSMCSIETFRRLVREDLAKHGMEIDNAR